MSRLIDADLLRAEFTGNFSEMWHYTGILAMVDCAPTAYDIDEKVEQLEAWKEKQLAIADREIAESDSELRKGIIKELKAITDACIENSIKIVKGGTE